MSKHKRRDNQSIPYAKGDIVHRDNQSIPYGKGDIV